MVQEFLCISLAQFRNLKESSCSGTPAAWKRSSMAEPDRGGSHPACADHATLWSWWGGLTIVYRASKGRRLIQQV